jgi:hypothetical protein
VVTVDVTAEAVRVLNLTDSVLNVVLDVLEKLFKTATALNRLKKDVLVTDRVRTNALTNAIVAVLVRATANVFCTLFAMLAVDTTAVATSVLKIEASRFIVTLEVLVTLRIAFTVLRKLNVVVLAIDKTHTNKLLTTNVVALDKATEKSFVPCFSTVAVLVTTDAVRAKNLPVFGTTVAVLTTDEVVVNTGKSAFKDKLFKTLLPTPPVITYRLPDAASSLFTNLRIEKTLVELTAKVFLADLTIVAIDELVIAKVALVIALRIDVVLVLEIAIATTLTKREISDGVLVLVTEKSLVALFKTDAVDVELKDLAVVTIALTIVTVDVTTFVVRIASLCLIKVAVLVVDTARLTKTLTNLVAVENSDALTNFTVCLSSDPVDVLVTDKTLKPCRNTLLTDV